jgi:hypothetical protein
VSSPLGILGGAIGTPISLLAQLQMKCQKYPINSMEIEWRVGTFIKDSDS